MEHLPIKQDIPRLTISAFVFSVLLAGSFVITLALQPLIGESLGNTLQIFEASIGIVSVCFGISYWVYKQREEPIPPIGVRDFQSMFPHIPNDKPEIVRDTPKFVDFENDFIVKPPDTHRKLLDLLWIPSGDMKNRKIKEHLMKEQHRFGILAGPSGCGKTVTSLKMGYDILQEKWRVFYCEATDLFASNTTGEIRNWIASLKGKNLLIIDNTHLSYNQIKNLYDSLTHLFQDTNIGRPSRFRLLGIHSNVYFKDSPKREQTTGQVGDRSVTFFPTVLDDDIGLSGLDVIDSSGIKEIVGVFPILQITEGREIAETIYEKFQESSKIPSEISFEVLFEQTGTVVELCEVLRSIRDGKISEEVFWKDIPTNALKRRLESVTDKSTGVILFGVISAFSKVGAIVAKDFLSQTIDRDIQKTIDDLVAARHLVAKSVGESLRDHVIMSHPIIATLVGQGSSSTLADFFGLDELIDIDLFLYGRYIEYIKTMSRTASRIGSAFLLTLSSYAASKNQERIMEFVINQSQNYDNKDRNIVMCLFNASSYYLKLNKLDNAEKMLRECMVLEPDFIQARVNLGTVYYFKGELQRARDTFEEISEEERDASFYGNLGIILYDMGLIDDGIKHLKKATILQPQDARYWHNLAKLEMESEKLEDAQQHFTKAIDIDPKNAGYYVSFSKFYLDRGLNRNAEELLQTALDRDIVTCSILINLGVAHKNQGRGVQAKSLFIQCIELESSNALAHANLADILHKEGKRNEAQEHLKVALKNDPNLASAYGLLGLIYQQKHMFQKAKKAYETAISKGYESYDLVRNLAFVYYDLKKIRKFDELVKRAEDLSISPTTIWLDAFLFLRKKDRNRSRKFHEKVTNFVNKCQAENNPAGAEEPLARLASIHPTKYELWANLGAARAALGKFVEAKEAMEKAIKLESKDSRLWHNLGNVCKELGLSDEAENAYRKARELAGISEDKQYFDSDKGWNLTS